MATNPGLAKLLDDATKYNAIAFDSNAYINTKIAETKADFDQFDAIALKSPNSVLKINTASYNGSSNNAITISLDNGSTTWMTVTAYSSNSQMYYKVTGYPVNTTGIVTASCAYEMLRKLYIHEMIDN